MLFNGTGGFLLKTMLFLANHTDYQNTTKLRKWHDVFHNFPEGVSADAKDVKCYGVYGCFPITYPWTTESRLVSLYPKSPTEIDPKFPVFTSNRTDYAKFLDLNEPEATKDLGINPNGPIYFIAHGYIDTGNRPWIQKLVQALLKENPESSVVVVDWGGGSSPPYVQAVANIRLVGAITAHIIHMIYEELGLPNIDNVHIMGHSLGSHLAGYAGYTLQRDFDLFLGRITGLDPAEPLFADTDLIVRLDRTDAKFIDIIHTDARPFVPSGGLGMRDAIGHVDFYPNGGYNNPGCNQKMDHFIELEKGSFFWGVQQFVSCDHLRAHQFMTESALARCPFIAITCESYDKFRAGECFNCDEHDNLCIDFGLYSYKSYMRLREGGNIIGNSPIRAFLMTDGKKPYCRTHYKVTIYVSSSDDSVNYGGEVGIMSAVIYHNSTRKTEKMYFTENSVFYEPGKVYSAVTAGRNIGLPAYAALYWEYKANPLNPLTWRILSTPRVYIDYIIVETMEHRSKIKLCPLLGGPVVGDDTNYFRYSACEHRKSSHRFNASSEEIY